MFSVQIRVRLDPASVCQAFSFQNNLESINITLGLNGFEPSLPLALVALVRVNNRTLSFISPTNYIPQFSLKHRI